MHITDLSLPHMGFLILVLGLMAYSCFLFITKRGNCFKQLGALVVIDVAMVLLAFALKSSLGAALSIVFIGVARLLSYTTLRQLYLAAGQSQLEGIGQKQPITALLFAFSMFAAIGISPFLTPDSKAFTVQAALQSGSFPALGLLVLGSILSAIGSIVLIQKIWLEKGGFSFEKQDIFTSVNFPALFLASLLVLMGVFAHDFVVLQAGILGVEGSSLPAFGTEWSFGVLILFGSAIVVTALKNVHRQAAYAAGLVAFLAAGYYALQIMEISALARLFALIVTGMGALVWIYSFAYLKSHAHTQADAYNENVYIFCLFILFGSLLALATTAHALSFFVFWELMTASSYVLIALALTKAAGRAAKLYFMMSAGAAAFLLPVVLFMAGHANSFAWADMVLGASTIAPQALAFTAFAALVAFGVKAGLVPAHAWLPVAHPAAPSSISAPLSGVLTKAGIFGIILVIFVVLGGAGEGQEILASQGFFKILTLAGLITMIYGEVMALQQQDIKRLFAYSTIGQIGEITLTLSMVSFLAFTGVLFHTLNHAIMKDLLFLGSGALILRAGGQNLQDLRGLGKKMPFTVACMVIGLLSIMGLPPFAGFTSKYIMIMALAQKSVFLTGAMLLASMAGCIYYMRIVRVLVFEPCERENIVEAPWSMRLPLIILAALCILLGLVPNLGLALVIPAVSNIIMPAAADFALLPSLQWQIIPLVLLAAGLVPFIKRDKPKLLGMYTSAVLLAAAVAALAFKGGLDTISFSFALIVPFIAALNMYYSSDYMLHSHAQWRFYSFFIFMCAGLMGVALSQDLFSFFFFWEIMSSWSLYFVIVHEENQAALREGFKYFFFNVLGAAFIFLGIAFLAGMGGDISFAKLKDTFALLGRAEALLVVCLISIGFVMKAAQLPFRIDMQMHPATAPTPVSGYISSVLLKSALFGLAKLLFAVGGLAFFTDVPGKSLLLEIMLWVGGITIVMSAFLAILQSDVKLVLIYSTVSQLGYMVLALALCTPLGVAGGLLHLGNHVLFKNLLFLVAGALIVQTGKHSLDDMGALATRMPKTFALFAVGALCVIGIPPSSGFTSKWIIYHALMEQGYVLLAILSLVGSVLTLAYMTKFMHKAFLGQASPRADMEKVTDPPKTMLFAMNVLALGCILTSVFPGLLLAPINMVLAEFGLAPLDVAIWGIASGKGAWNATVTSVFVFILVFGGSAVLAKLTKKRRISEIHVCGIDPETLHLHETARSVYTTPTAIAKNVADMFAKNTQK